MSVTAAKGFAASGVHAGIRRKGLDLAVVRSTVPAVGKPTSRSATAPGGPWYRANAGPTIATPWAVMAGARRENDASKNAASSPMSTTPRMTAVVISSASASVGSGCDAVLISRACHTE